MQCWTAIKKRSSFLDLEIYIRRPLAMIDAFSVQTGSQACCENNDFPGFVRCCLSISAYPLGYPFLQLTSPITLCYKWTLKYIRSYERNVLSDLTNLRTVDAGHGKWTCRLYAFRVKPAVLPASFDITHLNRCLFESRATFRTFTGWEYRKIRTIIYMNLQPNFLSR